MRGGQPAGRPGLGRAVLLPALPMVGLAVLVPALGRVFIFDVWKLQTLYIVLSFLALGLVLIAVGFVYNKYQEKFKEWL